MNNFEIENGVLKKYRGLGGAVVIPDSVTSIGDSAFFWCKSLTSVIIPDSVTSIVYGAFDGTPWLKNYPDDFVIVGSNILIKYNGNAQAVTIPDSVTSIGNRAFYHCESLTSFTYHGETFSLAKTGDVAIQEIIAMVENRDFSVKMDNDVKYCVIWSFFSHQPEDEPTIDYIKKNFAKMFKYLIDNDDAETVQKVLDYGKFLGKHNIDKHIQYAIDNKHIEIQVMLTNYKREKIGYSDPTKKLKL